MKFAHVSDTVEMVQGPQEIDGSENRIAVRLKGRTEFDIENKAETSASRSLQSLIKCFWFPRVLRLHLVDFMTY